MTNETETTLTPTMRKLVLALAPSTLALVVLMACEDSGGGGGPTLDIDSGSPNFDGSTAFDGSVPDAAPDAPVVPAVTVSVTGKAGPKAGVRVIFHAADGAVIETKLTGADGKATHTGSDSTVVSALVEQDGDRQIMTWTGVEVGDDLLLRDARDENGEESSSGRYNITLDSFSDSGADKYLVEGPCPGTDESYGTGASLNLYPGCTRTKNSVLGKATTFNGNVTGFAFTKGIDGITDGGTGAVVLGPWKGAGLFNLTVANPPGDTYTQERLLEISDGKGFDFNGGDSEDGESFEWKYPVGFAEAHQLSYFVEQGSAARTIVKRVPATAASAAIDFATALPRIDGGSIDAATPRRPIVSWETDGAMSAADGGLVRIRFLADGGFVTWTFVVPSGGTSVTAPAMPPEADAFLPFVPDSGEGPNFDAPQIAFIEADVLPNYAFFRRQQGSVIDVLNSNIGSFTFPVMPADGTYRSTSWTQYLLTERSPR